MTLTLVLFPWQRPQAQTVTAPVTVGTRIAGTFADASGHSSQSHLFYAANAGVWWLLTLTSTADSAGGANHIVKAYRSSGPDLATATWTAAADSPGASAQASSNCGSCVMGGGRALGVAYLDNAPIDVVHAEVAMAFDGQNGLVAHIRATVTSSSIAWETWSYHDEGAARWTLPRGVSLGASNGKYIHSAGPILQQEVDANVRKSTNPDTAGAWTTGFSPVAVVDNSMINQSNALAFARLAGNAMLAVFDNGGGTSCGYQCVPPGSASEPDISNLGYKKSNTDGTWPGVPVGSQAHGDGQVFSTSAIIDQNDWALVAPAGSAIQAFRSNAAGTGIDAAEYDAATNGWHPLPAPPLFAAGQAIKRRAGVFGASSGSITWVFVINTDAANSILYATFDGTDWRGWTAVPGTATGLHDRRFISGYPTAGADQIGLIWTEGSAPFDVVTTSVRVTPPGPPTMPNVVGLTQAAAISVLTTAGFAFGAATSEPSSSVPIGSVVSQSIAPDSVVPLGTAVDLVLSSGVLVPSVLGETETTARALISSVAGLTTGAVTSAPSTSVPAGVVISQNPAGGTNVSGGTTVSLVVSSGPPILVPNVVGLTQAAATTAITSAGLTLGAVTSASSATVPAGSVVSQTPAANTGVAAGTSVALVVSSGATVAPTVDRVVTVNGRGTRTTSSFSTASAGELLLAFVASDGRSAGGQTATVSGAGLTWTLVARANTRLGTSEIWQAMAAKVLTSVTVRSTQGAGSFDQSLTVVAFRNARGVGASATAGAVTGAPSVSIVTTAPASLVYAVGNDWDRAVGRTIGPNQTMVQQWIDTGSGDTFWVQRFAAALAASATVVRINDTAPSGDQWNFAAVEILAK